MPGFTEMSEEKTISLMMMTDYETFENDFEFDEGILFLPLLTLFLPPLTITLVFLFVCPGFDEEAIQLVDQLNEKAGISNALIPEISYNM